MDKRVKQANSEEVSYMASFLIVALLVVVLTLLVVFDFCIHSEGETLFMDMSMENPDQENLP